MLSLKHPQNTDRRFLVDFLMENEKWKILVSKNYLIIHWGALIFCKNARSYLTALEGSKLKWKLISTVRQHFYIIIIYKNWATLIFCQTARFYLPDRRWGATWPIPISVWGRWRWGRSSPRSSVSRPDKRKKIRLG